jgi:hypothetical protein
VDSYAAVALQKQRGKQIVCYGQKASKRSLEHMTVGWDKRYAATKGFLPKPQSQITLSAGKMKQNPGWDENTPSSEWTYQVLY